MRGKIGKIWDNHTKDNKSYTVIEIAGEKYSVWDASLAEGLSEGDSIEYDWKQSGNFRKITGLKRIDLNPGFNGYVQDRKSREIIRMSCLKSASELLQGIYKDPDQRTKKALEVAREFESYVTSFDEEKPEGGPEHDKGETPESG